MSCNKQSTILLIQQVLHGDAVAQRKHTGAEASRFGHSLQHQRYLASVQLQNQLRLFMAILILIRLNQWHCLTCVQFSRVLILKLAKKFKIYKEIIDLTEDKACIELAYNAAKGIEDQKEKAEALLFVVDTIDKLGIPVADANGNIQ